MKGERGKERERKVRTRRGRNWGGREGFLS